MFDPVTSSIGSICRIFMWLLQLEIVHTLELGGGVTPHSTPMLENHFPEGPGGLKNQVNINISSALPVASGWKDHRAYKVGIVNYFVVNYLKVADMYAIEIISPS